MPDSDARPDEIEPDIAVVRDSSQKQSDGLGDTASNPLGGLFKNLMTGITSAPAFERVDTCTTKNCGQPPPG